MMCSEVQYRTVLVGNIFGTTVVLVRYCEGTGTVRYGTGTLACKIFLEFFLFPEDASLIFS